MFTTILTLALLTSPGSEASAGATVPNDSELRTQCAEPLRFRHVPPSDAVLINSAASNITLGMLDDRAPVPPFGAKDSWRLQFQAGGGLEPKRTNNKQGFGGVGVSYFFFENISIDLELNGYYIQQRGSDTGGVNLGLLFRWHFINEPTWSIYADGGSGILLTGDRVPHNGTRFNFASQLGAGFSLEVAPEMRLMAGVRWQHISNASLGSNNPGRDNILGYAMISLPF